MNKVININLNGVVFILDELAFDSLKQYLDGLKKHFEGTQGGSEIIADIEARIAELLEQKMSDKQQVIQLADITEVITLMGNPHEIDDSEDPQQHAKSAKKEYIRNNQKLRRDKSHKSIGGVCAGLANYLGLDIIIPRIVFLVAFFVFGSGLLLYLILWVAIPEGLDKDLENENTTPIKRLFRNPDDTKIGGVCSGLAEYLGLEPVWFRIGFLIGFFIFGSGFIVYIILWIAIPKAKTSVDKLQMKGEVADVQNIQKTIRSQYSESELNKGIQKAGNAMNEILSFVFRLAGKIIGSGFILISVILTGCIIFLWTYSFSGILDRLGITTFYNYFQWGFGLFSFSFAALLLLIGMKLLFRSKFKIRYLSLLCSLAIVTGIIFMAYFGVRYQKSIQQKETIKEKLISALAPDTLHIHQFAQVGDRAEELESEFYFGKKKLELFTENDFYRTSQLIIKPSLNDSFNLIIHKTARGENMDNALLNAQGIDYKASYEPNTLSLSSGIYIPKTMTYKFQTVKSFLKVPVGTILIVDRKTMHMIKNDFDVDFDLGETFLMTAKGLKCLDCVESIDDEESEIDFNVKEDNGELDIMITQKSNKEEELAKPDEKSVIHIGGKKKE